MTRALRHSRTRSRSNHDLRPSESYERQGTSDIHSGSVGPDSCDGVWRFSGEIAVSAKGNGDARAGVMAQAAPALTSVGVHQFCARESRQMQMDARPRQ